MLSKDRKNRRRESALERTKARITELQASLKFNRDNLEARKQILKSIERNQETADNTTRNLKYA